MDKSFLKRYNNFFEKRKSYIFIFFLLLFVGVGFYSIYKSTKITEVIPFREYEIEIAVFEERAKKNMYSEDISRYPQLEDFKILYSFDKNDGEISFKIRDKDDIMSHEIDEIEVDFPGIIDNKTIKIYTHNCTETGNCRKFSSSKEVYVRTKVTSHFSENKSSSRIKISSNRTNKLTTKNELIELKFDLLNELTPRGEYEINIKNEIHGSIDIIFDLGIDYFCYRECLSQRSQKEGVRLIENWKEGDKNLVKLDFDYNQRYAKFEIDAISKKKEWARNFYLGLGISLAVASLMFLFQILYEKIEK